jgi:hypothetical protein
VLARVNGEAVTERQLLVSLESLIGEAQTAQLGEQARQNALKGLVAGRAIAQQALKSLPADELRDVELKTQLYREKLLLGEYLKQNARPEPVTDEMVKAYYDAHLGEYGGGVERRYEMIRAADKVTDERRDQLIEKLGEARRAGNWRSRVDGMNKQGLPVVYRQGVVNAAVLDAKLVRLAEATPVGETSDVLLIDGKPLVIRVTSETRKTARPLHEVSADIRKKLLPQRLKQAIKAVQEQVLEKAEVEYTGQANE